VRASAVSIEANIAEGSGRRTEADYGRFLDIALGSTNETECHLMIARDLGLMSRISAECLLRNTNEVRRMLVGLRRRLPTTPRF
jgi:four helix bundle protein